jgi:hypothetical protein
MDPVTKEITCYHNTFSNLAKDMLSSGTGLIMIFVPLAILVGGFFMLKLYHKSSRKTLIIYSVAALIIYAMLLIYFSSYFFRE